MILLECYTTIIKRNDLYNNLKHHPNNNAIKSNIGKWYFKIWAWCLKIMILYENHLGFFSTYMMESPLKNSLGRYLIFSCGCPFFPFFGISIQISCTFSMTIFMCLSKAFTFPSSFLLFLKATRMSLLALTHLVSKEKGPTLNVYSCGFTFSYYINNGYSGIIINLCNSF